MMANVTNIQISMESAVNKKRPYDTDGIDNIALSGLGDPAPEPTTMVLLGLGAIGLLRRRKAVQG